MKEVLFDIFQEININILIFFGILIKDIIIMMYENNKNNAVFLKMGRFFRRIQLNKTQKSLKILRIGVVVI